jgi:S-formylglutathione hydrolase FrmB
MRNHESLSAFSLGMLAASVVAMPLAASAAETFSASAASADPQLSGVVDYSVNSSYQLPGASNVLRILTPQAGVNQSTRFLYVLPVQSGLPSSPNYNPGYGDGMSVAQRLQLADRYNLVVVAPSFNQAGPDPWYADSQTTPSLRQESYITNHVVPFVDSLFPQAQDARLLLGYSKSGWGALNLIFRHPDMFDAAAVWDAPLMMTSMPATYPGASAVLGADSYFQANYRLDSHLDSYAAGFQAANRLWLGVNPGGNNFDPETRAFAQLLTAHGILHTLDEGSDTFLHSWDGGWVPGAMSFLATAVPAAELAAAVPEPATGVIVAALLLGSLAMVRIRRAPSPALH